MVRIRHKEKYLRKPEWLRVRKYGGESYNKVQRLLHTSSLNTVCVSANCPNRGECFNNHTATFLLMGDVCTRTCTFCNIRAGRVGHLDPEEPRRVAETVKHLGLEFAVITSVNRDDLPDGGAAHFAATIRYIRRLSPGCGVEVLIPDFRGDPLALQKVLMASPEILNHNLEVVPRLYPDLRPQASYLQSLQLLRAAQQWSRAHGDAIRVKTGIMVGVGEHLHEIHALLADVAACGVEILTIGQYMQPTASHHPVVRYYPPDEFADLARAGREQGIGWVESGPLVRSSYHAREQSESLAAQLDSRAARA